MSDVRETANVTDEDRPLPSAERIQELLFDAATLGRDDVIPALLQAGADATAHDPRGYTALILASYNGRAAATRALLDHCAPVNAPDAARGNTPLHGVAFKGYDAIAELLIQAGADVDARNAAGQTALMMAALFGRTAIFEMLIAAGADPEAMDAAGNSAESVAAAQGNADMLRTIAAARSR
jgi:ankyrin repeat protein